MGLKADMEALRGNAYDELCKAEDDVRTLAAELTLVGGLPAERGWGRSVAGWWCGTAGRLRALGTRMSECGHVINVTLRTHDYPTCHTMQGTGTQYRAVQYSRTNTQYRAVQYSRAATRFLRAVVPDPL